MTPTLELCGQEINGLASALNRLKDEVDASEGRVMPNFKKIEEWSQDWMGRFDMYMDRLEASKYVFTSKEDQQHAAHALKYLVESGRGFLRLCDQGGGTIRNRYREEYEKISFGVNVMGTISEAFA